MTYTMTVSPDFSPDYIAGWYIFNTWLQKKTGDGIHLELYDSFDLQRKDIIDDKIDIIFANPYEAAMLIREKGFLAIAAPADKPDEAVICVKDDSDIQSVEDLKENCTIAMADDPQVNSVGMIMLEPADLSVKNITIEKQKNYVLVAKNLINESADAGFFLLDAYDDMSKFVKSQIRPIITSQISVIRHIFLVGPKLSNKAEDIRGLLNDMHNEDKGLKILQSLGFESWENQTQEDSEFMLDLIDTLSG
ncbi:MAG: phosphate/phosphite/phosphonate ABC transporter substrate-binding protein [Xanthomonadales bacterium]|nr:phosphate/phosphite/phosphonate ABC transporter substrate-binding protein [Xanthomonadales bacterium]